MFRTRASLAPGPINVGRNFIDARIDLSNDQWTFRAGYLTRFDVGSGVGGRAFRSPSFLELRSNGLFFGLGNPSLEPSALDTTELAVNYRPTFIDVMTNLTFFWHTAHDIVAQVPNISSPNGFSFSNAASQEGYGFESDSIGRYSRAFGWWRGMPIRMSWM